MWYAATRSAPGRLYYLVVLLSAYLCIGCRPAPPSIDPVDALTAAEQLIRQSRTAEAASVLLQALRSEPSHTGVRFRLGELYLSLAAFQIAESHLLAAKQAGASASSVLPLLAETRLLAGEFDALLAMELSAQLSHDAAAEVLALQARALAARGDFDAAARQLQEAEKRSARAEPVRFARAMLLLERAQPDAAERALRDLLRDYPNSGDALATLADLLRDNGQLVEAEKLYTHSLDSDRFKFQRHFLRAEVRLDLGRIDAAREDADAVEAAAPDSFAALYLRARLLLIDREYEDALARFEAANKLLPSHVATLLYGGSAAYALGRWNLAEDWLLRVLKEAPENPRARLVMGAIRFRQGNYAEAEGFLRQLPGKLGEDDTLPRRLLAAALVAQNKAEQAVPLLTEIVAAKPGEARPQLDLSVALLLGGHEKRGLAILDALISDYPDYRPAYEYLIAYFVRERQWAQAADWTERFLAQYPADPGAMFFRGEMLHGAGQTDAARDAFEAAVKIKPGHPPANMRLASLALDAGDVAGAKNHFERILAADPRHTEALVSLAELAASEQHHDDAAALLARAVAANPNQLEPRMLLARLALSTARAQQAVDALQDAAPAAFRRDPSYLLLLAQSLVAAAAPQSAAEVARELVALRPDSLDSYNLYARVLATLDDKVALEDTLKQMLTIDPGHVPTRLELARLQIATERFEVAERLLGPLLADLDRPPLADFLFGLILTATDRAAQAVAPLKHAFGSLPSERTLLALVNAEAQAGRVDDAIARTAAWLEAHPDAVEVRVARAGHLVQAEQVTDAIAEYERVLELAPDHAVALNNLAWYALGQDPRRSIDYARRALEVEPDSVEVAHTMVSAQVESGEWRDAELTLDRVLPLHPTDTGLLWLSARVLHQKGRAEEALRRLERILSSDPPDTERERARALLVQIEDELRAEAAKKLW